MKSKHKAKHTTAARGRGKPVSEIIRNASAADKRTWFNPAQGGQSAPIAGSVEGIVPAMYQAWGAYGYQPAITWYQLANLFTSWEYTATEKIARTIAGLPAKLFRYENSQGKSLKPYYVKSLLFNELRESKPSLVLSRKLIKDHGIKRVEIDEHPFLDLVNKPNQNMVRFNFWRLLAIHLELNGAVGIYKAKPDGFGNPTELHVLPTTWTGQLKPIPSTDGVSLIKGYMLLDQDLHTTFDRDEIIWIHYTSLRNPYEGMSPIKAQLYAFNLDQYLNQQLTAFYKNGAMFSNVFSTEQNLTQDQYNSVAAQLQQYSGAKNAGQKFILHSGLKLEHALSTTAREAMIDEIERMARDKMLSSHDLSAGKIGLTEQQNRSNLEVVDMGFFNEAIKPRAMLITEYFDQYLVKNYDENLDFEFDYPHFQDRAQDIAERQSNLTMGLTTRNEERDKMGMEPVEGGDVILINPMNTPLKDVVNPPAEPPTPGPDQGGQPFGKPSASDGRPGSRTPPAPGEGAPIDKEDDQDDQDAPKDDSKSLKFDPAQARNEQGKWTAGGGSGAGEAAPGAELSIVKPQRERGMTPEKYEEQFGVKPASSNADIDRFLNDLKQTPAYKEVQEKLKPYDTEMRKFFEEHPELAKELMKGKVDLDKALPFWSRIQNTTDAEHTVYTPERAELHEEIKNSVLTDETKAEPGERPQAILMMGAPSSGRSEAGLPIAKNLVKEVTGKDVEFAILDSDRIKAALGAEKWNVAAYHEEATDVVEGKDGLITRGIENNHNLIFDMTGANSGKMNIYADDLKAKGYNVHVVCVKVESYEAANRAWSRYIGRPGKGGGRFVDPEYAGKKVDGKPAEQTFPALKSNSSVDSWALINNSGTESITEERGKR